MPLPESKRGFSSRLLSCSCPAFLRDASQRDLYWKGWLETTLLRDLPRVAGRSYDPDLTFAAIERMGTVLREGELPSLRHFPQNARKLRALFSAMEEIFLLRRIVFHEAGKGKEAWLLNDSGLCAHVMGTTDGEGAVLSLVRHFLWNEWSCQADYQGRHLRRVYVKSAKGSPVDAVLDGIPYRIVPSVVSATRQRAWEEKPLLGMMKLLKVDRGFLVAPVEKPEIPDTGIGVVPWSFWS